MRRARPVDDVRRYTQYGVLGGNLIGFFDRLKLGDPPKARTEEEARGGQTDEGERGGEVTQL